MQDPFPKERPGNRDFVSGKSIESQNLKTTKGCLCSVIGSLQDADNRAGPGQVYRGATQTRGRKWLVGLVGVAKLLPLGQADHRGGDFATLIEKVNPVVECQVYIQLILQEVFGLGGWVLESPEVEVFL